jgi:hypothetical protein
MQLKGLNSAMSSNQAISSVLPLLQSGAQASEASEVSDTADVGSLLPASPLGDLPLPAVWQLALSLGLVDGLGLRLSDLQNEAPVSGERLNEILTPGDKVDEAASAFATASDKGDIGASGEDDDDKTAANEAEQNNDQNNVPLWTPGFGNSTDAPQFDPEAIQKKLEMREKESVLVLQQLASFLRLAISNGVYIPSAPVSCNASECTASSGSATSSACAFSADGVVCTIRADLMSKLLVSLRSSCLLKVHTRPALLALAIWPFKYLILINSTCILCGVVLGAVLGVL